MIEVFKMMHNLYDSAGMKHLSGQGIEVIR